MKYNFFSYVSKKVFQEILDQIDLPSTTTTPVASTSNNEINTTRSSEPNPAAPSRLAQLSRTFLEEKLQPQPDNPTSNNNKSLFLILRDFLEYLKSTNNDEFDSEHIKTKITQVVIVLIIDRLKSIR